MAAAGANAVTELDALTAKAQAKGRVPVILRLNVNFQAESSHSASGVIAQRNAIADARRAVVQSLAGKGATNIKEYQYVPYLAVTVNSAALQALSKNPKVLEISEDVPVPPTLAESTGVVGADIAWQSGYDGSGWAVAVLDTGVDKNHNFLSGKVISEACYSTTTVQNSTSLCPGGVAFYRYELWFELSAFHRGLRSRYTCGGHSSRQGLHTQRTRLQWRRQRCKYHRYSGFLPIHWVQLHKFGLPESLRSQLYVRSNERAGTGIRSQDNIQYRRGKHEPGRWAIHVKL